MGEEIDMLRELKRWIIDLGPTPPRKPARHPAGFDPVRHAFEAECG